MSIFKKFTTALKKPKVPTPSTEKRIAAIKEEMEYLVYVLDHETENQGISFAEQNEMGVYLTQLESEVAALKVSANEL